MADNHAKHVTILLKRQSILVRSKLYSQLGEYRPAFAARVWDAQYGLCYMIKLERTITGLYPVHAIE